MARPAAGCGILGPPHRRCQLPHLPCGPHQPRRDRTHHARPTDRPTDKDDKDHSWQTSRARSSGTARPSSARPATRRCGRSCGPVPSGPSPPSTAGAEDTEEALRLAIKRIDKAAAKGVIHKNQAANRKSRLDERARPGPPRLTADRGPTPRRGTRRRFRRPARASGGQAEVASSGRMSSRRAGRTGSRGSDRPTGGRRPLVLPVLDSGDDVAVGRDLARRVGRADQVAAGERRDRAAGLEHRAPAGVGSRPPSGPG